MNDGSKDEPVLPARLLDAARAHHEPPPAPREELWARIQGARGRGARPAAWQRPQVWVPVAIAATLVIGFALGRFGLPIRTGVKTTVAVDTAAAQRGDKFTRYAAEQTFGKAELLLTQYRADAHSGTAPTTTPVEARKLLVATRLLLDSPSLDDQQLRGLLEDLELVLAQIAEGSDVKEDRAVITDGLDRRAVLPRLRAAIPATTGIQLPGAI